MSCALFEFGIIGVSMKWLFIGLFIIGGLFANAWYGAEEPKQTRLQKRAYGLIALGIWMLTLILANTLL